MPLPVPGGNESNDIMMKLFIGNLSYETSTQDLRDALSEHEPILEIQRPHDRETGKPRGFAFVTFESREAGETAMEALDGTSLDGRELRVNEAEDKGPRRRPAERSSRVSMDVDDIQRVDDRPVGPDGKKVRYKSI